MLFISNRDERKRLNRVDNLSSNFIKDVMIKDLESGKHDKIITRFPQSQMDIYISVMLNPLSLILD